jgi:hypothetical protein
MGEPHAGERQYTGEQHCGERRHAEVSAVRERSKDAK